jgi:hypothetical protein
MTGNTGPATINDAELTKLVADHHTRLVTVQRQNAVTAELRQHQHAKALGVGLV